MNISDKKILILKSFCLAIINWRNYFHCVLTGSLLMFCLTLRNWPFELALPVSIFVGLSPILYEWIMYYGKLKKGIQSISKVENMGKKNNKNKHD